MDSSGGLDPSRAYLEYSRLLLLEAGEYLSLPPSSLLGQTTPSPPRGFSPSPSPPPVLQLMTNHVSSEDEMLVTSGGDRIGHSLHRAEDPVPKSSSANQRLPAMAIGESRPAVEHPNMADDHPTQPIINRVVRASAAECSNAKKRKKSDIWDHFTEDIPYKKANCNYCGKSLIHTSNYGTSSLRKHLRKCPAKTATEKGQTQLAANEVAGSSNEMIATKFDQAQIRENISRYIVMCGVPFSTVEHPAFREMLKHLQPEFMPNDGLAALGDAIQLYQKEKKILQDVLLKVKGRISLTFSKWPFHGGKFVAIAAHYTDDEWELKSRVINVRHLDGEGFTEYDWDEIQRNLIEWGIAEKLFSIVDDYARHNAPIPSTLIEQCESSLPPAGSFCPSGRLALGEILQGLVESQSISRINDAIDFVYSSRERQILFHSQRSVSSDGIHMRVCKIEIPWTNRYPFLGLHETLKLVIRYKDAFTHFNLVESFKHPPTEEDWSIVTKLCEFLKVINDTACKLEDSSTSMADVYLYQFCMFGSYFIKYGVSYLPKEIIKEVVVFNQYWDECCIMLSMVVVFDPRKKLDFVKFCFSKAYGETATKYVDDVNNSLAHLFIRYKEKRILQPQSNVANDDDNGSGAAIISSNHNNVMHEFNRFKQNENRSQPPERQSELVAYLKEESHPHNTDFNILKWWQVNESKYPTLAAMARDMLAFPISTADSDLDLRSFREVGDISPSTIEALVCLKDWLRESYLPKRLAS